MKSLIHHFPAHINEALENARTTPLRPGTKRFDHVVITGLGGSGIGGTLVSEWVTEQAQVPVLTNKDYQLPHYVGANSLVIACSYSGNTEETLAAAQEALSRGAEVAVITSGGTLLQLAEEKSLNRLVVPGGNPPRSMLGHSLVCLLWLLRNYGIVLFDIEAQLEASARLLEEDRGTIMADAEALAGKLKGTLPILYAAQGHEGVAVRWRQQLNENSKMLCWHAIVPEMNHNELVGWAGGSDHMAVLFLRNKSDLDRNQKRIEINKEIVTRYTPHVFEVWSKGDSVLENALYLIHIGDWLSYYLSELNGVDILEIDVINFLKGELAKF